MIGESGAVEAPEDDLRSSLEGLYDGGQEAPEIVSEAVVEEAPAETAEQRTERLRDESGRFTKADTVAVTQPKSDAATPTPASTDDPTKASTEQPSTAADAPPVGWTPDAKAEWANLSPAVKAAALKREAEIAEGGRQWSEQRRRYESTLAPLVEETSRLGIDPAQGLNQLIAAHRMLQANPAAGLRQLASQYGINLETLAGQRQAPADGSGDQVQQPNIEALVRQAVMPYVAPLQQRFATEEQRQQQAAARMVDDFAAQPGREHFAAVSDDILAILPHVKASNPHWTEQQILQEAYDRAVYSNPTTRTAILAEQQRKADEQRQAESRKKTASARLAASSVTGSPGGTPAPAPKDSIRAELEAAFSGAA